MLMGQISKFPLGCLENYDLKNEDLRPRKRRPKKKPPGGGGLIEVCEMPHPRTKPKQHIHSKSQCNLIKRAKRPRKSLIAASYPRLVISNAKVYRSTEFARAAHFFAHRSTCRRFSQVRTKISWMHFRRFPFTQNLRNFGNSGNCYSIFPEKFPEFRKRFQNANHSTRNFRHLGTKLNAERRLPDDNFRKFGYILRKCCSTRYCMEVAENLNQRF